jgi:acylphosphatase
MPPADRGQRRAVHYSGHVQGVGFRVTASAIARGFRVTGYVRNLPDGRVELIAEGEREELETFLKMVRSRMQGLIRNEASDTLPATGEFHMFEVRH